VISKLRAGQTLWWVTRSNFHQTINRNYEVVVEKMGRTWAYLSNGERIDRNLIADGGQYSSPGRCYFNKEHYLSEMARQIKWDELYDLVRQRHVVPHHLSTDEILKMIKDISS